MIPAKTIHTKDGTIGHWPPTEYTRKTTSSAIRQISAVVIPLYIFGLLRCALILGRKATDPPQQSYALSPISFSSGIWMADAWKLTQVSLSLGSRQYPS
jgi:hypothetical protein